MRKLYNGKGKRIHPSPPPSSPFNFLAALPSTLLTLAAALSPEEKEVLVYLLSSDDIASGKNKLHQPCNHGRTDHPPELGCGCFVCYMSFWARWNASPNHLLIHRIIDAFEGSIEPRSICSASRRRRRRDARRRDSGEISPRDSGVSGVVSNVARGDEGYDDEDDVNEKEFDGIGKVAAGVEDGRSSVRRLVSFIGERVWGVWNY